VISIVACVISNDIKKTRRSYIEIKLKNTHKRILQGWLSQVTRAETTFFVYNSKFDIILGCSILCPIINYPFESRLEFHY